MEFRRVLFRSNLLNDNLDAAVIYSPLSYQEVSKGTVRILVDFATAMPANLTGGWAVKEKDIKERPDEVRRWLNAIYGSLQYMMENTEYSINLNATKIGRASSRARVGKYG